LIKIQSSLVKTAVVCYEYDPVVAMETVQVAHDPISSFLKVISP